MYLQKSCDVQRPTLANTSEVSRIEEQPASEKNFRRTPVVRVLRTFLLGVSFLLPLTVFPGLAHPFSRPQLIFLAIVVLLGLLGCARQINTAWSNFPAFLRLALAAWMGAVGASAVWGEFASPESLLILVLGVGWLLVLMTAQPSPQALSWALVASGSAVSVLALAQFFGGDPFSLAGWIPLQQGSERMRVFGTLGNPNFVAAFLAGLLPLTFSLACQLLKWRHVVAVLCSLQAAALLATGSRAPVLALATAFLWMRSLSSRKVASKFGLAALSIAVLAAVFSPARGLETTLRGRIYIWKVSAPHLADHFLFGLGPGGFGAAFPAWETQYWQAAPSERNRSFAGIEDHAHNDYLEVFADTGLAGLLAFVAVLIAILRQAWFRARAGGDRLVAGASAGVVALAAVAFVDFPLMRPAESFLFWSLVAVSLVGQEERHVTRGTCAR